MILRQWHGWTDKSNAGAYAELFRTKGPNVERVEGRRGAYLLRRDSGDDVEFVVQHIFDSMEAIRAALGEDYEAARLIPGAEALLSRYDGTCTHYEIDDAPRE